MMNPSASEMTAPMSMTQSPKGVALAFFDAYRARDVKTMQSLFTPDASFNYVPTSGGPGKVNPDGVNFWSLLIETFPDLTNEVTFATEDSQGYAFVSVFIGGTQTKDIAMLTNHNRKYWLEHLFIFHVNDKGLVDSVKAYWDDATWFTQLGHLELSPTLPVHVPQTS